jgi:hypothetical protein
LLQADTKVCNKYKEIQKKKLRNNSFMRVVQREHALHGNHIPVKNLIHKWQHWCTWLKRLDFAQLIVQNEKPLIIVVHTAD